MGNDQNSSQLQARVIFLQNFKRNIIYVYSTNILNGVLGIILVPLCVKMMGTSGYGIFSIYSVLISYLALADMGISKNLLRLLSSDRDQSVQCYNIRIALGMYLVVVVVLLLMVPVLLLVVPAYIFPVSLENLTPLRYIVTLTVIEYVVTVPLLIVQNHCIANERFDRYSKFTFISGIYRYVLLFTGIWLTGSPVAIVAIMAARRFIDLFAAKRIMGTLPVGSWKPVFNFVVFRSIVSHSSSLTCAQLFQSTFIAMGSFLVNINFGLHGLGIYRAVFDLVNKIWFVSNGLALILFPKFSQMLSGTERKRMAPAIFIILCLSWAGYNLVSITGTLFAGEFMSLIGLRQSEMKVMFMLLLLGVCINSHASLSYEFLQAAGRYRLVAVINLLVVMLMYLSFSGAIHTTGIYAIAWAWIISQTIYCLLVDTMSLREMNMSNSDVIKLFLVKMAMLVMPLMAITAKMIYLPDIYGYLLLCLMVVVFAVTAIKSRNIVRLYRINLVPE